MGKLAIADDLLGAKAGFKEAIKLRNNNNIRIDLGLKSGAIKDNSISKNVIVTKI